MNIYDLARASGVSIATASKALNGRVDVNAETRSRVIETARRLDYHPSHMARGLARRRTENIGVVALRRYKVPFFTNPFYSHVIEGMEQEVTLRNYNLLLSILPADDPAVVPFQLPRLVREKNADGLVLLGQMPPELTREVSERGIPGVFVDFHAHGLSGRFVLTDNRDGERRLVEHLARLGHRRLAFVQSGVPDWSFAERQAGFESACEAMGAGHEIWHVPALEWPVIEAELGRRLSGPGRPTAVLAVNDEHALAVLRSAEAVGLRVPEDLSVAGFDDIEGAGYAKPRLCTVKVDKISMGRRAIQHVFEMMEKPLERESLEQLPVELVIGESTGPARR